MKVSDYGFFLASRDYSEKTKIIHVFSKENGVVKGLTRQKKNFYLVNLDELQFIWKCKDRTGLGFITFEVQKPSYNDNQDYVKKLIKASSSELCLKFLPVWQRNIEIFKDLQNLITILDKFDTYTTLSKYILWEINFLKNLGYGLNLNKCSVTGKSKIYFLSPKSGNAVCYDIGKKYEKKLFKIPDFFLNENLVANKNELINALKILGYFFYKFFYDKKLKLIFREQILKRLGV